MPDRSDSRRTWSGAKSEQRNKDMSEILVTLALLCGSLQAQVAGASIAAAAEPSVVSSVPSVNPVIEWNRTLLVILRTAGAQPPTIHSTRSFAILLLPYLTQSTTSTEPTVRTWSVSRTSRAWLHNRLRQTKRRMTSWSHSTQRFRPRSTLNFSRTWRRFRRDRTRRTASPSDKPLPPRF